MYVSSGNEEHTWRVSQLRRLCQSWFLLPRCGDGELDGLLGKNVTVNDCLTVLATLHSLIHQGGHAGLIKAGYLTSLPEGGKLIK